MNFILFTTRNKHSLKGNFNHYLQPAVQKFFGFESQYKINSGKIIENHLGKLMGTYKEEMKEKKEFWKNFPNTWSIHVAEKWT